MLLKETKMARLQNKVNVVVIQKNMG